MNDLTIHAKITQNQLTNEFDEIIARLSLMFNDLKYEIGEFVREVSAE